MEVQAKSVIVGTAGHIDHGKTALVKVLTGIDADRLQEEKRRGMLRASLMAQRGNHLGAKIFGERRSTMFLRVRDFYIIEYWVGLLRGLSRDRMEVSMILWGC